VTNWRRGLLRAWALLSALWIIGFSVFLFFVLGRPPTIHWGAENLAFLAGFLFVPPLALLALGVATAWVLKGFRRAG
jgi:hypothetical protein